eukprot:161493-Pelagomonas_calceolata.AAC.5
MIHGLEGSKLGAGGINEAQGVTSAASSSRQLWLLELLQACVLSATSALYAVLGTPDGWQETPCRTPHMTPDSQKPCPQTGQCTCCPHVCVPLSPHCRL